MLAMFREDIPIEHLLSEQQEDICAWFMTGTGHLTVEAKAGSGKTWTILKAIEFAPESTILLAAFNKAIQEVLEDKLTNPNAVAQTVHSVGFGAIREHWGHVRVADGNDRAVSLAKELCGWDYGKSEQFLVAKLLTKVRELLPLTTSTEDIIDLAVDFDCLPETWSKLTVSDLANLVLKGLELACTPTGEIDYADMIFLPLRLGILHPVFDLVVVDEAQDMTVAQLEILRRVSRGRIVLVGDSHQCQPAGTQVQTSSGPRAIETLKPKDTVISWDRHAQCFIQSAVITTVQSRPYAGPLVHVKTATQETQTTLQHRWLVRWAQPSSKKWIVYLMRKGSSFRIGQCQMFRKIPPGVQLGLFVRVNQELADAAWILSVQDSRAEALIQERILSARYGLPELCFEATNHTEWTKSMQQRVWTSLGDLTPAADRCLQDHRRCLDYPFYRRIAKRLGRQTLFETEACNLLSDYMAVPVAPEIHLGFDKAQRRTTKFAPIQVSRTSFAGLVYSLDVAKHHKYVADGLVTCNSIYRFRGADSHSLSRLKQELHAHELGLNTTYRCPRVVVAEAQHLVPDYLAAPNAPEGVLSTIVGSEALLEKVRPGDFVLSRKNAPLMPLVLRLLRNGVPARMQGRDVGRGLLTLVKRLATNTAKTDIVEWLRRLRLWHTQQIERLTAMGKEEKCEGIIDKCEMLYAIASECRDVADLQSRLSALFADAARAPQVVCSSVHKAKGLEADHVFILKDTLYGKVPCECGHFHDWGPCKRCRCKEMVLDAMKHQEEKNIAYVAITRAKQTLTWVEGVA